LTNVRCKDFISVVRAMKYRGEYVLTFLGLGAGSEYGNLTYLQESMGVESLAIHLLPRTLSWPTHAMRSGISH
jgi:hypothetical protein